MIFSDCMTKTTVMGLREFCKIKAFIIHFYSCFDMFHQNKLVVLEWRKIFLNHEMLKSLSTGEDAQCTK